MNEKKKKKRYSGQILCIRCPLNLSKTTLRKEIRVVFHIDYGKFYNN